MAAGDQGAAVQPDAKPRRRFAPQLVEETVKSSSSVKRPAPSTSSSRSEARKSTRDASVQVDDLPMTDAPPPAPRRRFAPVPIETTFNSNRVDKASHGPTAELTPDPSPTNSPLVKPQQPQPKKKPTRRFAPQLIETSRRVRREGQEGPATKPTDKTDITPGTNHIYVPKTKRKLGPADMPRNSIAGLAAEDKTISLLSGPRRQNSLKPHFNTRRSTRTGSFHPDLDTIESSCSEGEDAEDKPATPNVIVAVATRTASDGESWSSRNYDLRNRRESCDEEFSGYLLAVAAREAFRQRELEQAMYAFPNGMRPMGVEHFFVREHSDDDLNMDDEEEARPPRHGTGKIMRRTSTDPGWAAKEMRQHAAKKGTLDRTDSRMSLDLDSDYDVDRMDLVRPPEDPLWTTSGPRTDSMSNASPVSAASLQRPLAHIQDMDKGDRSSPEVTGFRKGPFGNPFDMFGPEKEDRELRRMRKAAAPPMLGGDLKFRMCPSPKLTRMEPEHPYPLMQDTPKPEAKQRDETGETGLWRGYCVASANEEVVDAALQGPHLLATPIEPSSPADPFSSSFSLSMGISGSITPRVPTTPAKTKGLHHLSGLDERLKKERARKELEELKLAEFDEGFVTQVYNYISLGYPAMARSFDDELSKITGVRVNELRQNDDKKIEKGFMLEMELSLDPAADAADGSDGSSSDEWRTPEDDEARFTAKPPRWRALRLYIREWARQHPDFGEKANPLAWGVRARRGSWAI